MAEAGVKLLPVPVLVLVLVLVLLGCSLAHGSRCDVMNQLRRSLDKLSAPDPHGLDGEHFMAKLVCYANVANGLNTSAVTQLDGRGPNVTFYGTFQLPNDLVCSDGTVASRNLCEQDCSNFVNSDIEDDALCLFRLLLLFLEHGFEADQKIQQYIQLIFNPACANALDDGYAC
ncbi:alpha-lactalbumin-like [Betta splendens]|uniref:lysozyme n=1 Tax=Betta splendens TaxID=158456 RepID=A0A6P7N2E4_BETSP|nr:alpha-lactalbumin-like [Betta splendens]